MYSHHLQSQFTYEQNNLQTSSQCPTKHLERFTAVTYSTFQVNRPALD